MKRKVAKWTRAVWGDKRSARFRQPMHRTLSPLLDLPQLLGHRIGFISAQARNRFKWIPFRFIRQVVSALYKHLGMALNVWRDRDAELFFVFEHKADYSLPLYLTFLLKRRPVFFFVHDMQQVATITLRCRLALKLCRAWVQLGEFYPVYISLDDSKLGPARRFASGKKLTIPHPHHLADHPPPPRPFRQPGERIRVGIIGTVRKEKPIRQLLETLQRAQKRLNFQLVVGTPLATKPAWLDETGVEILDTTTEAQYAACLSSLDVFVVDFLRAEYYFRPSGAVVDAAIHGCYVICPDFPVFRAQINEPVSVGATFQSLDEIPGLIANAMKQLDQMPVNSAAWRQYRRVENIAAQIRDFLETRRAATNGTVVN
jgi:glycosyltransferase involved in cell wall biosynthesis